MAEKGYEGLFEYEFAEQHLYLAKQIDIDSYDEPENYIEGIDENDIKIDYCVTPNKIFSFL